MFNKITIIGAGLIGSSLARAIKAHKIAKTLIIADASEDVCKTVLELGFADKIDIDLVQSVQGSELVILATPVGTFADIAEEICPFLQPGAILTDVGSTKKTVIDNITPFLPESVHLLPAHPIAGTEHSGPKAGFAELFQDRWCIITPAGQHRSPRHRKNHRILGSVRRPHRNHGCRTS